MFQLTIPSALLKCVVTCLKEFVDSVELVVDPTGIHITTLDEANVCLLRFYIAKQELSDFEVSATSTACFPVGTLDKALKSAKKDVKLSCVEKAQALVVQYKAQSRDMKFSIPLRELIEKAKMGPPATAYYACVSLESKVLGDVCSGLKNVGEDSSIVISPSETVTFKSSDEKMGELDIELDEKASMLCEDKTDPYEVKFSTAYLTKLCKIAKKMNTVQVKVPVDCQQPVNFTFGTDNGSQMEFILAAKK
jgi:hypothetical protein